MDNRKLLKKAKYSYGDIVELLADPGTSWHGKKGMIVDVQLFGGIIQYEIALQLTGINIAYLTERELKLVSKKKSLRNFFRSLKNIKIKFGIKGDWNQKEIESGGK